MQTFLIVLAVLFCLAVFAYYTAKMALKFWLAKGGILLLKAGIETMKPRSQAQFIRDETRQQLADLESAVDKLPPVTLFSAGQVLQASVPLFEKLAALSKEIEAAHKANEPAPTVEILPAAEPLALTDGSGTAEPQPPTPPSEENPS